MELVLRIAIAVVAAVVIWRLGRSAVGAFAQPLPEPPPPGELRKVRVVYRCTMCGTEVRMTLANDENPAPPRHCMDEMEFVRDIDDDP